LPGLERAAWPPLWLPAPEQPPTGYQRQPESRPGSAWELLELLVGFPREQNTRNTQINLNKQKLGEPSVYLKPVEQTLYSATVPIKKNHQEIILWCIGFQFFSCVYQFIGSENDLNSNTQ